MAMGLLNSPQFHLHRTQGSERWRIGFSAQIVFSS